MNIRCETLLDYPGIAEVNILAFKGENEAQLIEKIRLSDRYIPELSLVAEIEGRVIGSALVKASLEIADNSGEAIVIVLGYPTFYTRFGFVPSVDYKIESPFLVPDDVFMVKTLQSYDKKYKGKVIYPPAFNGV